MRIANAAALVAVVAFVGTSCANKQQTGTLIGAGAGAAAGAAIGKGSVWGILAGAAIGGAAGNLIGKSRDEQARELEQAVPTADVQRVGEGINMTFDSSLMFATGSSTLQESAKGDLAAAATVFKEYPDTNILVEGHTDNTGTDAINDPLSQRRAQSVSSYLVSQGVAANRLEEKWYGSKQPKVSNDTEEGRAQNRRVELAIYANDDMVADAKAGEL